MTILQAIQEISNYPVPLNAIEKVCIERGLTSSDNFTLEISGTDSYKLAEADIFSYLGTSHNIVEQEVGLNAAIEIKKQLLEKANKIYGTLGDPKFNGVTYGFIGENYNG